MYKTMTFSFNIKRVVFLVAAAGMLLSVFAFTAQPVFAQSQESESEEEYVSEDLVAKLEKLQALVEQLVLLVEQVRGSRDTGSTVSGGAQALGDNIVRVFVGNDLESIRYRENREEALALCMDSVQLGPRDDGYGTASPASCTYNGETIYSGVTEDVSSGSSAFDGSNSTISISSPSSGSSVECGPYLDSLGYQPNCETNAEDGPDLVVTDGRYSRTLSGVRFYYTVENIGTEEVNEPFNMLMEVDLSCNGNSDYYEIFSAGEFDGDAAVNDSNGMEGYYFFTNNYSPNNPLIQSGAGCFGFTADYLEPRIGEEGPIENDGRIQESDEDNNFSGWIDFGGYSSEGDDGESGPAAQCPDGYYWDDKETRCVSTSQSGYRDGA